MAGLGIITSTARTRPRPSTRGMSCCETTPCKMSDSCARTCGCCWSEKMSMMRLIVCTAELVSVETRWPVSATTRHDFSGRPADPHDVGSWRAQRSASAIAYRRRPRWLTTFASDGPRSGLRASRCARDARCWASPPASTCRPRPVTSTEPRGSFGELGNGRKAERAWPLTGWCGRHRERRAAEAIAGSGSGADAEVELLRFLEAVLLRLGEHTIAERLGVVGRQRRER